MDPSSYGTEAKGANEESLFRLLITLKVQEWALTAPPFHLITDFTYLSIRHSETT